jgi:hypothetical protein
VGAGVYRSTDSGASWNEIGPELGEAYVYSLALSLDGHIYAGTSSSGVFRSKESVTSVQDPPPGFPASHALHQNFPNPFNPTTTIRFSIPTAGDVSLKIFNLLGERVATLVSGNKDAGTHTVQWDATGQPSGVYFYRLQAGDFSETRRLVLIK